MYCVYCGSPFSDVDRFCPGCGKPTADSRQQPEYDVNATMHHGETAYQDPYGMPMAAPHPAAGKKKSGNTALVVILVVLLVAVLAVAGVILWISLSDDDDTASNTTVQSQTQPTEAESHHHTEEVFDYLGANVFDFDEVDYTGEYNAVLDDAVCVSFCDDYVIHHIELTEGQEYSIGGVYLGMKREEAKQMLTSGGFTDTVRYGDGYLERSNGEVKIFIGFDDVVTKLYAYEDVSYGDGYCDACDEYEAVEETEVAEELTEEVDVEEVTEEVDEEVTEEVDEELTEEVIEEDPKDRDYLLPYSHIQLVTEEELAELSHEELCFARNEIYARHGREFKHDVIRAYFESKDWYHGTIPAEKFNVNVFSSIEKENIKIIEAYEANFGGSYY